MENNSQIFKQNLLKNMLLFLGCSAFVVIGIFLIDKDPLIGWGSIIFFGLGVVVSLIQFHPNASYLKLNEEGFEVKGLFRSNFTKWSHVKDFRQGQIKSNKMIFFNYTEEHKKWKQGKKLAKLISGNEGAIQSSYNIKTHELLDLMKAYKLRSNHNV